MTPRTTLLSLLVAMVVAGALAAPAPAQQAAAAQDGYLQKEIPEAFENVDPRRRASEARATVTSRAPSTPEKRRLAEDYYGHYLFAWMTRPEARSELPQTVAELLRDLTTAQRGSPMAEDFRVLLHRGAWDLASKNYHPAVRVNGALMLARVYKGPGREGIPEIDVEALGRLLALYNHAAAPDGVRAAALSGIQHIVQLSGGQIGDQFTPVARAMLPLLENPPPEDRDRDAHGFFQRYAVNIVLGLNNETADRRLAKILADLSANPDVSPVIATHAAETLSRMQRGLDGVQIEDRHTRGWTRLVQSTVDREIARLKRLDRPAMTYPGIPLQAPATRGAGSDMYGGGIPGGDMYGGSYPGGDMYGDMGGDMYGGEYPGGDMYGGGYPGGGMPGGRPGAARTFKEQPLEVISARRSLNLVLQSLLKGINGTVAETPPRGTRSNGGLLKAAPEDAQPRLTSALALLREAGATINDRSFDDRKKFLEMLEEQSLLLAEVLGDPTEEAAGDAIDELAPPPTAPEVATLPAR